MINKTYFYKKNKETFVFAVIKQNIVKYVLIICEVLEMPNGNKPYKCLLILILYYFAIVILFKILYNTAIFNIIGLIVTKFCISNIAMF